MSAERGFTLVEILVAGLLAALALLAVAAMSVSAYSQLEDSSQQTSAAALGQQRIEWLRNQGYASPALNPGVSTEVLTGAYAGYTRVTTVQSDIPRAGVKQITVSTSTPSGMASQVVALIAEP